MEHMQRKLTLFTLYMVSCFFHVKEESQKMSLDEYVARDLLLYSEAPFNLHTSGLGAWY